MRNLRNIIVIIASISILGLIISCEKNTEQKMVNYFVKGLASEYKVTYFVDGESKMEVVSGGKDFKYSFMADQGQVLYFNIKYKDQVNKMSNFASMITVKGEILTEAYAYDMKWADSPTVDKPYPFEIILRGTVPY